MHPAERGLAAGLKILIPALVAAAGLLFVDLPVTVTSFLLHLGAVVGVGLVATVRFTPLTDDAWYAGSSMGSASGRLAGGAAVTALVVGVVALLSLGSGAAMRYDPSLQFLLLLSAMDIAWTVAAFTYGIRWLTNDRWAVVAAAVMTAVCIWSLWRYLDVVGLGEPPMWVVDGAALMRLVLPFDLMAAVIAIAALVVGSRRQATEQPRAQS